VPRCFQKVARPFFSQISRDPGGDRRRRSRASKPGQPLQPPAPPPHHEAFVKPATIVDRPTLPCAWMGVSSSASASPRSKVCYWSRGFQSLNRNKETLPFTADPGPTTDGSENFRNWRSSAGRRVLAPPPPPVRSKHAQIAKSFTCIEQSRLRLPPRRPGPVRVDLEAILARLRKSGAGGARTRRHNPARQHGVPGRGAESIGDDAVDDRGGRVVADDAPSAWKRTLNPVLVTHRRPASTHLPDGQCRRGRGCASRRRCAAWFRARATQG